MKVLKNFLLIGFGLMVFSCSKDAEPTDKKLTAKDKAPNRLFSGDSGLDILSNDLYDKLKIEIGYVTGFRPTTRAIADLTDYLTLRTFKENIEITYLELDSPAEDDLTLPEIDKLEEDNRTAYTSGTTLAVYIYFADAPAEGDDLDSGLVTLGAVYRNTSMVIHEKTVRALASRSFTISDADVETTTLNHEFGHLFGLVDLGATMVNDHQSQSENDKGELVKDNHCNVNGCLMRAELQFGGGVAGKSAFNSSKAVYEDGLTSGCAVSGNTILSLLNSSTAKNAAAPALDSECLLDLAANGGR
jgi:hypothetical protein